MFCSVLYICYLTYNWVLGVVSMPVNAQLAVKCFIYIKEKLYMYIKVVGIIKWTTVYWPSRLRNSILIEPFLPLRVPGVFNPLCYCKHVFCWVSYFCQFFSAYFQMNAVSKLSASVLGTFFHSLWALLWNLFSFPNPCEEQYGSSSLQLEIGTLSQRSWNFLKLVMT